MKPICRIAGAGVIALLLGGGCATTDQRILQLQQERQALTQRTEQQEQTIARLSSEKDQLSRELDYYSKRAQVLAQEKTERIREAQEVRKGVRQFTDEVLKTIRDHSRQTEIVDYVGSELFARKNRDPESNRLLVDKHHPIPADGTITGLRAYLTQAGSVQFCVLREDQERKLLLLLDTTSSLTAATPGFHSWVLDIPLAVHKGDLVGIYCPEAVIIPYDDADTGHVVALPGPVTAGQPLTLPPAQAERNRRAYSFGAIGFFKTP